MSSYKLFTFPIKFPVQIFKDPTVNFHLHWGNYHWFHVQSNNPEARVFYFYCSIFMENDRENYCLKMEYSFNFYSPSPLQIYLSPSLKAIWSQIHPCLQFTLYQQPFTFWHRQVGELFVQWWNIIIIAPDKLDSRRS